MLGMIVTLIVHFSTMVIPQSRNLTCYCSVGKQARGHPYRVRSRLTHTARLQVNCHYYFIHSKTSLERVGATATFITKKIAFHVGTHSKRQNRVCFICGHTSHHKNMHINTYFSNGCKQRYHSFLVNHTAVPLILIITPRSTFDCWHVVCCHT